MSAYIRKLCPLTYKRKLKKKRKCVGITDGKHIFLLFSLQLVFSIAVRRNSSLYMQSMVFPSVILTTIALLGFYLPPESGERIGLQITILLTFMVRR